jgi:hypothetical protein
MGLSLDEFYEQWNPEKGWEILGTNQWEKNRAGIFLTLKFSSDLGMMVAGVPSDLTAVALVMPSPHEITNEARNTNALYESLEFLMDMPKDEIIDWFGNFQADKNGNAPELRSSRRRMTVTINEDGSMWFIVIPLNSNLIPFEK